MSQSLPYVPFIFIRHGYTDWSFNHLHLGILDLPLNTRGIKDVQETAKKLLKIENPIIISSPKKRTLETASIIGEEIKCSVQVESVLDARYYGDFSQDIKACHEFQKALNEKPIDDMLLEPLLPKDAEKKDLFDKRVLKAFEYLLSHSDYSAKSIIIVSHGEVYKSLCNSLCKQKLSIARGDCRYFYPKQNRWAVSLSLHD